MTYTLPTSLDIAGAPYAIHSDYRRVLEIFEMLSDPELSDQDHAMLMLEGLFCDFESIPAESYQEAVAQAVWFLDGGIARERTGEPVVMDWAQDYPYIIAPVNRIMGCEIRALAYCHWWTFLAAWQEIGECFFSHLVSIRMKRAKGKKLDKDEQAFYKKNRQAVELKRKYTNAENDLVARWS